MPDVKTISPFIARENMRVAHVQAYRDALIEQLESVLKELPVGYHGERISGRKECLNEVLRIVREMKI